MSERRRVAPWVALVVAVLIGGFVVVLAVAKGGVADSAATPLLGQPAPVVQTTTIDGQPFDLASRRGSWVVMNFFQTQCVPCVEEHPELVKFAAAQKTAPDPAELVTVINYDTVDRVRQFFAEKGGGDWPILQDPDGRIYVSLGVAKVPETWIIDPSGIVVQRIITTITADYLATELQRLRQVYG
jgi:cytochrome c biogenesis protein CcmG, thiol:disulfide interchange protein DsbE